MKREWIRVCATTEAVLGESVAFQIDASPARALPAFLLHHRSGWRSYLNLCPHWQVDLDLGDERFYDAELDRIYCKNHGALFLPETGACEFGPCVGGALRALETEVRQGGVWVRLPSSLLEFAEGGGTDPSERAAPCESTPDPAVRVDVDDARE